MASLTVRQLRTPVTKDEALQILIDQLAALGFSSTSWQAGSVQRSMLETFAQVFADETEGVADITEAGFNETSSGGYLTLLSASHYDNDREEAGYTEGLIELVAAPGSGPYSVIASQLVAVDSVNGFTYRNTGAFTIPAGGTVSATFKAETAGADRDVAPNTILELQTPLAGVTINNPIPSGATSWITVNGSDEETDDELRERNRAKWALLSPARPSLAYASLAREAAASVTRAFVDDQNPRGPGTVDVYIAGASGELSSAVVSTVQDYLDGVPDGVGRVAVGADVQVFSALRRDVTIQAKAYILAANNDATTQALIVAALNDYFRALDVGGYKRDVDAKGVIVFGELYRAFLQVGVRNVAFTTPLADITMERNEVAIPVFSLSWESV